MNKDGIINYNRIDFNNISFGKKKNNNNNNTFYIDIKYNYNEKKYPLIFKCPSMKLISNIKYNFIRGQYIECLIPDEHFYLFILKLEDYIKHLLITKSKKIFTELEKDEEMDGELIDEIFKTNIRLDRHYKEQLIKFNIKNSKNSKKNTLLFLNKKNIDINELDNIDITENLDIITIIYFKQIIICGLNYEFDLFTEEIRLNKSNEIEQYNEKNRNNAIFPSYKNIFLGKVKAIK